MNEITTQELKKLMDTNQKYILLDCRGIDYYNWEHLPHSINLRWKYVKQKAEKLLENKKVLIITSCDGFTCNASIRCFENLKRLGYTNLLEYSGGIADWVAQGFLTESNYDYRISSNIYRFPNQTFYGNQVGSYLLEEDNFILLIDGPQNLSEEHEDFILHFDKPIHLFMSHGPTAGSAGILQKKYNAKIYLHKADSNSEWLTVKPDVLFADGFRFNKNLIVVHTPGHTPGSSVLYDQKNKILFTGDHIQGMNKKDVFDFIKYDDGHSGNTSQRLKSAQKLLKYDFDKILPFHYEMIRNKAKEALNKFVKKYENNNR